MMVLRLMLLMPTIMIGRSNYKIIILIFAFFCTLITACIIPFGKEPYDGRYDLKIQNETSDTLLLVFGTDDYQANLAALQEGIEIADQYRSVLNPLPDSLSFFFEKGGAANIYDGEDPIFEFFETNTRKYTEQIRIYRRDTLVANWIGPGEDKGERVRHYFNYHSWEMTKEHTDTDEQGEIKFTILPSDVE